MTRQGKYGEEPTEEFGGDAMGVAIGHHMWESPLTAVDPKVDRADVLLERWHRHAQGKHGQPVHGESLLRVLLEPQRVDSDGHQVEEVEDTVREPHVTAEGVPLLHDQLLQEALCTGVLKVKVRLGKVR